MTAFVNLPSFFRWLHDTFRPRTYVELGAGTGDLLTLAQSAVAVGIDPGLDVRHPILRATKLFPNSAAEFFGNRDLAADLDGRPLDVGLIRNASSAEEAWTAFAGLERAGGEDTLIVIAGGPPLDLITALADGRPDLRIAALAVGDTDLFLIRPCRCSVSRPSPQPTRLDGNPTSVKAFLALKPFQARRALHGPQPRRSVRKLAGAVKTLALAPVATISRLFCGPQARPRALGVLLCYNDADILGDAIEWLAANNHDIIAWDHGSDDGTAEVLDAYRGALVERRSIPRDFDFYRLYPTMSANLLENYVGKYDWVSWPDQDELLEGPWRDRTYYEYVTEVFNSPFDWVQFNNYNYWFTSEDNPRLTSPVQRVRRYCLFPDCALRIRCWRASATNIRHFNHNPPNGRKFPLHFNLRHYPMRSHLQMLKRIQKDRSNIQRGEANYHYNNMRAAIDRMIIPAQKLHFDDGREDLDHKPIFPWRREIYGFQPLAANQ